MKILFFFDILFFCSSKLLRWAELMDGGAYFGRGGGSFERVKIEGERGSIMLLLDSDCEVTDGVDEVEEEEENVMALEGVLT
jgi:hypothetical protein